jgi:cytidylate kinase
LPGAGKTTIARQLPPELRARGYLCGDRDLVRGRHFGQDRVSYAGLGQFYLRNPSAVRSALRLSFSAPPYNGPRIRAVLKLLLWSYRLKVAQETGHDIVVLDQGVVQQAWSAAVHGELRDESSVRAAVSTVLRSAHVPLVLVYVDIGVHLAVERIGNRPTMRSTYDRISAEAASLRLAANQQRLATIFEHAVEDTGAAHLRVDGSRSPIENCRRILELVDAAAHASGVGRQGRE